VGCGIDLFAYNLNSGILLRMLAVFFKITDEVTTPTKHRLRRWPPSHCRCIIHAPLIQRTLLIWQSYYCVTRQHEESVCSVFMFDVVFNLMIDTFYDFSYQCSTLTVIRYNVFLKLCLSVRRLSRVLPADARFSMRWSCIARGQDKRALSLHVGMR
jgi:hypothetical protein